MSDETKPRIFKAVITGRGDGYPGFPVVHIGKNDTTANALRQCEIRVSVNPEAINCVLLEFNERNAIIDAFLLSAQDVGRKRWCLIKKVKNYGQWACSALALMVTHLESEIAKRAVPA